MKRILVLTLVAFAAAAVLPAQPVPTPCPTSGTLQDLINLNATGGCTSQDKLFNNFVYTLPEGGVPASAINVNLVIQTGTQDIHGWSFFPTQAWVLGWTLSYDISVLPGNLREIVGSKDQMNPGALNSTIVINDMQTGVTPAPMTMTGAVNTVFSNPYNLQTVHTVSTATIPEGQNLLSYEQDFFEAVIAPPESCGCTFTQGYWSNKPGVVWPASRPQQADLFFNSGLTYQQIMDQSVKGGNAYINLAHQYIAATLNVANGACAPQSVVDVIAASSGFFSGFDAGSYFCASNPKGCPLQVMWAGILADYNQGTGVYASNPGHCTDESPELLGNPNKPAR
ncbi:MAG: hypothetical protein ABFD89_21010 [Bryobacteraceae bacterium]